MNQNKEGMEANEVVACHTVHHGNGSHLPRSRNMPCSRLVPERAARDTEPVNQMLAVLLSGNQQHLNSHNHKGEIDQSTKISKGNTWHCSI